MSILTSVRTISIIGGKGEMGKKFAKAFRKEGCKVLISDVDTSLSNIEAASKGDVVIVTVPISSTEKVIKEILPHVKQSALVTDFTSVKVRPMEILLSGVAADIETAGGHPLFGPTTDFENQNIILCKGRTGKQYAWYKSVLKKLGLKVIEMSADEHDRHMAVIQCLTHFSNLSLGSALAKLCYGLEEGEKIATPVYKLRLYGVGRILAQDPVLYTEIQKYNPYAREVSQVYLEAVQELNDAIRNDEDKKFLNIFVQCQKYFGTLKDTSLRITDRLIKVMK